MTAFTMIATISDLFSVMLGDGGSRFINYILHFLYLFFNTLVPFVFCIYIILFTDTWHILRTNKLLLTVFYFPAAAITVLFVLNPFSKLIFYIDPDGHYIRGAGFLLMHIVSFFYVLFEFSICAFITGCFHSISFSD